MHLRHSPHERIVLCIVSKKGFLGLVQNNRKNSWEENLPRYGNQIRFHPNKILLAAWQPRKKNIAKRKGIQSKCDSAHILLVNNIFSIRSYKLKWHFPAYPGVLWYTCNMEITYPNEGTSTLFVLSETR